MKRFTRAAALPLLGALLLSACGEAPDAEGGGDAQGEDTQASSDAKACMITDQGGVDDASFNETSYDGLLEAEEELGIEVQVLESASESDFEPNMQTFIQQGDCDVIVPVGFLLEEVTFAAAEANPDQNFAIIDVANPDGVDNILGTTFETDQAAFLAGYASAATTETGIVGTYGGINIPTVTIFMDGFLAGVDHYNEQNDGDVEVLGWDGEEGQFSGDFESLDDGRRITESLLDNGADTIMPVAGPVGGGSAAAIEDRDEGRLVWVDTDGFESTDFGELIFTSVLKGLDTATYTAAEAIVNDEFEGGNFVGTLENDGVALAPFHDFEDELPEGLADELEALQQQIIDGEVEVRPSA